MKQKRTDAFISVAHIPSISRLASVLRFILRRQPSLHIAPGKNCHPLRLNVPPTKRVLRTQCVFFGICDACSLVRGGIKFQALASYKMRTNIRRGLRDSADVVVSQCGLFCCECSKLSPPRSQARSFCLGEEQTAVHGLCLHN